MTYITKTLGPVAITFVVGVLITFAFFFNVPALGPLETEVYNWGIIISCYALGLGTLTLLLNSIKRVKDRKGTDWIFAIIVLVILGTFSFQGIISGTNSPRYQWLYNYILLPLNATMYASTVFYLSSAYFRVFRARNVAAVLLLISSVIFVLFNMPLFTYFVPQIIPLATWINDVIVNGVYRTIIIGVGIGSLLMAYKVIIGVERSHLGKEN